MKSPFSKFRPALWYYEYRMELWLCFAIMVLALVYLLFPDLRQSLKNLYFVPVVVSSLMLGWKKSSAFTVLGVSLVLCITCHDWAGDTAREFFELVIWGCTLGATSGLVGLIVLTKDRQVLRLLERQNSLAMTDQLTQVANRRAFDNDLRRKISEVERYQGSLSVLMIDIDYFKKFNDHYGHHVGDRVLQTIARTIESSLREADLVARFGGEEFAVLLPKTPAKEALIVAERIRAAVDEISESDVNCPEKVSVSIGVTEVERGDTQATILERADIAMYEAKRKGRNRVCQKGRFERGAAVTQVVPGTAAGELVQAVFEEGQAAHRIVDPVAGLCYHRIFDDELTRRMYESTRYGVDLCLGLIELEPQSDREANKAEIRAQVAHIGRTIDKTLRTSDLVTWYSEFEFAILFPFTRLQDGEKVLQRLHVELNSDLYQTGISSLFRVKAIRAIQMDGSDTKGQAISKLRTASPIGFSIASSFL